jgi:hypothetical protein
MSVFGPSSDFDCTVYVNVLPRMMALKLSDPIFKTEQKPLLNRVKIKKFKKIFLGH